MCAHAGLKTYSLKLFIWLPLNGSRHLPPLLSVARNRQRCQAFSDVNQLLTEQEWAGKARQCRQPNLPTAPNWCHLTMTFLRSFSHQLLTRVRHFHHQLPDDSRGDSFGARKQKVTSFPISVRGSLWVGCGGGWKVGGRDSCQRPVSILKRWVNSLIGSLRRKMHIFLFLIVFISPSFIFGNGCCHITRINGSSGNEPKPFNPVLLYNANVFLSNVPKYANHHLQHKFSESYKYLPKCDQTSLKKSLGAHELLHTLASSPLTTPQPPFSVTSSPRWGAPQVPSAGSGVSQVTTRQVPLSSAQPQHRPAPAVTGRSMQARRAFQAKPLTGEGLTDQLRVHAVQPCFWIPQTCTMLSS